MKIFSNRNKKWGIALGIILALMVVATIFLPRLFAAPDKIALHITEELTLPELTGPFQVGRTTVYMVDENRAALPDANTPREFVVTIFYPAIPDAGATPGLYADDMLAKAYSSAMLTKDSAGALDHIHSHAYVDVPADHSAGAFPVLLFSPGGGEQPVFYTALLEQISSLGYVVVAVPEPFDTPVIPLPDGRVLSSSQRAEWCAQSTKCQEAMQKGEAGMQEIMNLLKDDRAKDMMFTLDQLEIVNQENQILAGVLDLEHVGVFGHSFGGASSVRLAQLDKRIDAVAVLDSDLFLAIPEDSLPLTQPVLHMTAENIDATAQELADIRQRTDLAIAYLRQTTPYYFRHIAGTTHQSFQTDAMFLAPYISFGGEGVTLYSDKTTPTRITHIISTYVLAFFDQHLKNIDQPLLTGISDAYPEITITP